MRVIAEIKHPEMHITMFYMNQKYLVKCERNRLEQVFKFSDFDFVIQSAEDLKVLFNKPEVIAKIVDGFRIMEDTWQDLSAQLA